MPLLRPVVVLGRIVSHEARIVRKWGYARVVEIMGRRGITGNTAGDARMGRGSAEIVSRWDYEFLIPLDNENCHCAIKPI